MDPTRYPELLSHGSWAFNDSTATTMSYSERVRLSYQRARELCRFSGMTVRDVLTMSQTFWNYHRDLMVCRDSAAHTILTIHWNLCMGTIAALGRGRDDLLPLLAQLQNFDLCGEFMLTEVGHGLDARNIETTATRLPDGSFDLHSPTRASYKIMPPATLTARIPRVAVVYAQLLVDGERRGVRAFVVRINDIDRMCDGIVSRALPPRPGAKPVDHAITSFRHVRLAPGAMLGSLEKPRDLRIHFLQQIYRVSVGTLGLSMVNVGHLALCAWIAAKYSIKRNVAGTQEGSLVPIISFRTQQRPILHALAASAVYHRFSDYAITNFTRPRQDPRVAHGIATVYKALVVQSGQLMMNELVDRLGWQGLYGYNTISEQLLAARGNAIAEGDILVLCIRLASELLQGRYSLPPPRDPTCLLARHEAGLIDSARRKMATFSSSHRSDDFNAHILPRCKAIVEAVGQRMAYEAARDAVRPELLACFEAWCMLQDPGWYVEHTDMSHDSILDADADRLSAAMPLLDRLLDETNVAPVSMAPILSDHEWDSFVSTLPIFTDGRGLISIRDRLVARL